MYARDAHPLYIRFLRAVCALLCILPLLLCRPILPAAADPPSGKYTLTGEAARTVAQGLLADGLKDTRAEIDLSAACLPRADLGTVFARVMDNDPELFFVKDHLSYTYDASGRVLTVTPAYRFTGEELTEAQKLWDDTLSQVRESLATAQALAGADGRPGAWGEADTVLFLHDYLASTYDYDVDTTRYDALSLFRDGTGVCQAYALAFLALARDAGLEVDLVVSREMDHAWNHVRVDGSWYHVDVTRDDPIPTSDSPSAVCHDRLLRSDAAMEALGYVGFSCAGGHACADGRFETTEGGGILSDIRVPLTRFGTGWFAPGTGEDTDLWVPINLPSSSDEGNIPAPLLPAGDMDRDGVVTPGDLLYLETCLPPSELSRAGTALRRRLLQGANTR